MKLFIGRVHEIRDGTAYVTVRDTLPTGLHFHIQCDAEIVDGIQEEFILTMSPLQPKRLTEAELRAICAEVDRRLK